MQIKNYLLAAAALSCQAVNAIPTSSNNNNNNNKEAGLSARGLLQTPPDFVLDSLPSQATPSPPISSGEVSAAPTGAPSANTPRSVDSSLQKRDAMSKGSMYNEGGWSGTVGSFYYETVSSSLRFPTDTTSITVISETIASGIIGRGSVTSAISVTVADGWAFSVKIYETEFFLSGIPEEFLSVTITAAIQGATGYLSEINAFDFTLVDDREILILEVAVFPGNTVWGNSITNAHQE